MNQVESILERYTLEEILTRWDSLETAIDREFFGNLLKGTPESFAAAFAISPDDLSSQMMTLLLAEFAERLFVLDEQGTIAPSPMFLDFNNAILNNNTILGPLRHHSNVYLEMLYIGTAERAEMFALYLGINGWTQEQLIHQRLQYALAGMWFAQGLELYRLFGVRDFGNDTTRPFPDGVGTFVSDISFATDLNGMPNGGVDFTLHFPEMLTYEMDSVSLSPRGMQDFAQQVDSEFLAEKRRLIDARDNFSRNLAVDIAVGAPFAAASFFIPAASPIIGFAEPVFRQGLGLSSGNPSVSGIANWQDSMAGKGAAQAGQYGANHFIRALSSWRQINADLSAANHDTFMRWFGVGTRMGDDMVFSGLYDPVRISMAMEWEQNGLVGMLGLEEDDPRVESVLTALAGNEDALLLLEGGFPILTDGNFDGERFLAGISALENHSHLIVDGSMNSVFTGLLGGTE